MLKKINKIGSMLGIEVNYSEITQTFCANQNVGNFFCLFKGT